MTKQEVYKAVARAVKTVRFIFRGDIADTLTNHFCREFRDDPDFIEIDFMVNCGYKQTVMWKA